jgi:hypothetical protein
MKHRKWGYPFQLVDQQLRKVVIIIGANGQVVSAVTRQEREFIRNTKLV